MTENTKKYMVLRDVVRWLFIINFFAIGEISEAVFGTEFEFESEFVVLGAILLFGSFWCGWFCPFGNVQYFANKLGKKYFSRFQIVVAPQWDKPLRYLKYVFLAMFVYVMVGYDISYFGSHEEMYDATWYTQTFMFLKEPIAIFFVALLIPRFFCRYMCYQKAMYQIINKVFPIFGIHRKEDKCNGCQKCNKECLMAIDIASADKIVGGECIGCMSCVTKSCSGSALELMWFGKAIPTWTGTVAILVFYSIVTAIALFGF